MTGGTDELSAQHRALIEASAISPEVAAERGYRTVRTKAELRRLGLADSQCRVPALHIPIYGTTGELVTFQTRPDQPRVLNGKALKYETPKGSRMALDVPLQAQKQLSDPRVQLFITEGSRKADAGVSHGLCTIALLGVWNWRGRNEHDGKATLPDWDDIALNGREVFIVFDSDVMTKPAVYDAMSRLKAMLERRDARVRIIYLDPHDGSKVGLDDYFAAGGSVEDLLAKATSELIKPPSGEQGKTSLYHENENGLVWNKPTNDGPAPVQLTNFTAKITTEIEESDGVETTRSLEITSVLAGRKRVFEVPAASFHSMNWVMPEVGAGAILQAGQSIRDHTRAAIQTLSGDIQRKMVHVHTGWTQIDGGYYYLHAGGAIGPNGLRSDVQTRLSGSLEAYLFTDPRQGEERGADVRASMRMIDLGPRRLGYLLMAAVYRAPMGDTGSSLHMTGPTGTLKTESAAIAQAHWGSGFDGKHLPGAWSSTENALEMQAFLAKDAIFTIDDFAPGGTANDVARLHQKADRIFRAQGNRSGRGRMRKDLKMNAARPPRGMVLSTGEDTPSGHSIRARITVYELSPGDIDTNVLSELQAHAREGVLARALAAFVQWVAPNYEEHKHRLLERQIELRDEHRVGTHTRTPSNLAELLAGFELFLEFAKDVGAVTGEEAEAHLKECRESLIEVSEAQAGLQANSEPTTVFVELVSSALASGEAHLSGLDGEAPPDEIADGVGWRRSEDGAGNTRWRAQGERIGWIDGADVFLLPAAAHKAAQGVSSSIERLSIGSKTLGKRLDEKGLLKSREEARGKYTLRKQIGDGRHSVLHMSAATFGLGAQGRAAAPEKGNGPQLWAPTTDPEGGSGPEEAPAEAQEAGFGPHGPHGPQMEDGTWVKSEEGVWKCRL